MRRWSLAAQLEWRIHARHLRIVACQPGRSVVTLEPATRLEDACASDSAAIYADWDAIEAGRARVVLMAGAENMTTVGGAEVPRIPGNCGHSCEAVLPHWGLSRQRRGNCTSVFRSLGRSARCAGPQRCKEPRQRGFQSVNCATRSRVRFLQQVVNSSQRKDPS